MKVYIVDNYDSFTYNLYQFIGEILNTEKNLGSIENVEIIVKRNDKISIDDIRLAKPDRIIISPGPGSPDDKKYFGVCADIIKELGIHTPLLGVCLGMQGVVHVFGGKIVKADTPMHGKISPIKHNNLSIFKGMPNPLEVMRYHSLIAEANSLPECLELTASIAETGEIMAVKHKQYPIYGIQFHPESFATEGGKDLLKNFLMQN